MTNQPSLLDDVRRALGRDATLIPEPLDPFNEPVAKTDTPALIERFTEEARAVRAEVHRLIDRSRIAETIRELCGNQTCEIALSGADLFDEIDLQATLSSRGLTTFDGRAPDHKQLIARLADCGVGVTTADYAIAETGTIVLSSDEPNALLVSLLPPVHIAVVCSSQIALTLSEVIGVLHRERLSRVEPSRSVSFITGPSRTGDVELVLSIGVHGPKQLHVIVCD